MTDSNIDGVVRDVRETKQDLKQNVNKTTRREGKHLADEAERYISEDSGWTGRMRQAISMDYDSLERGRATFTVYVDSSISPYSERVEFGSGGRTGQPWEGSVQNIDTDFSKPKNYPYDAPTFSNDLFLSMMAWIKTKPIQVDMTLEEAALEYARSIANNGTFMHPFMRPAYEDRAGPNSRGGPLMYNIRRTVKDAFE